MKCKAIFTLVVAAGAVACSTNDVVDCHTNGHELPPFAQQLIADYEEAAEGHSLLEIWQYEYEGEAVFYIPLSRIFCCDRLSMLYDTEGEVVCMPDGGFTGHGDGRCPDFVALRSNERLVWRGERPSDDADDE